ncbi:uncharacterized protein BDR25DRAFT_294341 [Lindgomyces ingoldianus]|uniref:Uncharacterized protein n=1 Tax=Lindgomyces ingoldianus TaxID=673940 RepID=A0ACB6QGQ5_9PLEO|nr:uncharacterized protein BDR25DRAFT_294341 [Lindgomyces ingoldianus]KAF2466199.1 hypothetical protein BDR25DRAFT_294341 [Lindgomyces ingoldianus]
MRLASIFFALSVAAISSADTPPEGIGPDASPPAGCKESVNGKFTIGTLLLPNGKSRRETAQEAADKAFVCTLQDGILHDPYNRTGSIVANRQFQFDGPPQAGAIYTGGWSFCKNNTLALGGSTLFYQCLSGGFNNIYDQYIADQCAPVNIAVSLISQPSSSSSSAVASSTHASTKSSSASASGSLDSASASVTAVSSRNGTLNTASPSISGASSASITLAPPSSAGVSPAPSSSSTGGAVPTRVPRRETFGAVVGILGAALIL